MCFKTVPSLYGREAVPVNSQPSGCPKGCFWIAAILLGMRFSLTETYSDFLVLLYNIYCFIYFCQFALFV